MSLYVYHFHIGGPSRLVWFVLGATAATIWVKRKEIQKRRALALINGSEDHSIFPWGSKAKCDHHHHRQREPEPLPEVPQDHQAQAQHAPSSPGSSQHQQQYSEKPIRQSSPPMPLGSNNQQWEVVDEREKTSVISVEMLDNVVSTVDELKAVSLLTAPSFLL